MGEDEGRWADAACRKATPEQQEYFFPKKGRPSRNPKYRQFCDGCLIRAFCLSYAIVHDEEGVWGGKTDAERRYLLRGQPNLKGRLTQEARSQGWYEFRKSVEEILAPLLSESPQYSEPTSNSSAPVQKSPEIQMEFPDVETLLSPVVQEVSQQISLTFDTLLAELLEAAPRPIVLQQSYAGSIQFPSVEELLLDGHPNSILQTGS